MNVRSKARCGIALAAAALALAPLLLPSAPAGVAMANTEAGEPAVTTTADLTPTTTAAPAAPTAAETPATTAPATAPDPTTTTALPTTTTTTTTAPAVTTTTAPPATTTAEEALPTSMAMAMAFDMGLDFVAAASVAAPGSFSNPAAITIPEPGFVPPPWPGTPYPSVIPVSGLTGTITDVNVTIPKLACARDPRSGEAWPEDFDLLLVGPTGANVVLVSDVGGDDEVSRPAPNLALTFDDSAPRSLPADAQLASGTFKPTDDDDDRAYDIDSSDKDGGAGRDLFPAPAPVTGPSGNLAVFNGTNPNGNWQLYASDDRAGFDRCELPSGWSLEIVAQAGTQGSGSGQTTSTSPGATTVPGSGGTGTTTGTGVPGGGTEGAASAAGGGGAARPGEVARAAGTSGARTAVAGAALRRGGGTGPLASTGAPLALWTQTGVALMAAGTLLVRRARRAWPGR